MKSSISSYSFAYSIKNEGATQISIISKAKDLGFDAIEFTDLDAENFEKEAELARIIKSEADRVGIEISCYSVGADLLSGSGGNLDKEV